MNYKWNWGVFLQQTPDGDAFYWEWILWGFGWTLAISAVAWVIALVAGSVIGVIRTTERRWRWRAGTGTRTPPRWQGSRGWARERSRFRPT